MSHLPTREEINIHDSLDEQCAERNFLGKTLAEAEEQLQENFLRYGEDLMWMGPQAFCFYVEAAVAYLCGPSAAGDADAVSSFCALLGFRLAHDRDQIAPVLPRLADTCTSLRTHLDRFAVDPGIYGDLADRLARLETDLRR